MKKITLNVKKVDKDLLIIVNKFLKDKDVHIVINEVKEEETNNNEINEKIIYEKVDSTIEELNKLSKELNPIDNKFIEESMEEYKQICINSLMTTIYNMIELEMDINSIIETVNIMIKDIISEFKKEFNIFKDIRLIEINELINENEIIKSVEQTNVYIDNLKNKSMNFLNEYYENNKLDYSIHELSYIQSLIKNAEKKIDIILLEPSVSYIDKALTIDKVLRDFLLSVDYLENGPIQ